MIPGASCTRHHFRGSNAISNIQYVNGTTCCNCNFSPGGEQVNFSPGSSRAVAATPGVAALALTATALVWAAL